MKVQKQNVISRAPATSLWLIRIIAARVCPRMEPRVQRGVFLYEKRSASNSPVLLTLHVLTLHVLTLHVLTLHVLIVYVSIAFA